MIGLPHVIAVRAGSWVETVLLRGAFTVIAILSALGLAGTSVLHHFNLKL
jgi:hypothetical protein